MNQPKRRRNRSIKRTVDTIILISTKEKKYMDKKCIDKAIDYIFSDSENIKNRSVKKC